MLTDSWTGDLQSGTLLLLEGLRQTPDKVMGCAIQAASGLNICRAMCLSKMASCQTQLQVAKVSFTSQV